MTPKAATFAKINRSHLVVSAQWLDAKNRNVTEGPETWVKLRHRFNNGQQLTIRRKDIASMNEAGFEPRWVTA